MQSGGVGKERWVCESKWWQERKVGQTEIQSLIRKGEAVKEEAGKGLQILRLWFLGHNGFTKEAEYLMKEKGMFWSTRDDLNGLLQLVGLRQLPDI